MKNLPSPHKRKIILQISSLLAAIVLWIAITHSEDPTISMTINNIPLETVGGVYLSNNNLVFVNENKLPNIAIDVRGRRSDVKSILNSVTANINLSNIRQPGEYVCDIDFEVPNSSVMITRKRTSSINVIVEKTISKTVPVYIKQSEVSSNKTHIVKSTASIESVTIAGTSSDISKIKEALVDVNVSKMTADNILEYPVSLADENHNIVTPNNKVKISKNKITIHNEVYYRNLTSIIFDHKNNQSGYQVIDEKFSIDKIEIGVSEADIDKITQIYATFASPGISEEDEKFKMKLIIPEGVYCPEMKDELIMTAKLEKSVTTNTHLPIEIKNAPADTNVALSISSVYVEITGAQSKIDLVKAFVDLTDLSIGTHTVPIFFTTEDVGIIINGSYSVEVTIQ